MKKGLDRFLKIAYCYIALCEGYEFFARPVRDPGEGFCSMAKKLYVGNLSYNTTEDSLRNLFSQYGSVTSAKIIFDRESGNSKGFGFVEMGTDDEASAAIAGTNGNDLDGRQLRVNEAMDKPPRRGGSNGGYSGGNNW
jgi:RNA recognition motif-containing protein